LKPLFDEEPNSGLVSRLVIIIWENLGSITENKEYEKNQKYADESEIHEKTHPETEDLIYKG